MARGDAVLRAAHPLTILTASAAVWTAGAVLHYEHVSALDPALVSLAVAAFLYGKGHRPLAAMAATAGAWLTAASGYGVLAGPDHALSLLWGSVTVAALIAIRRSAPVRDAKQWRAARFDWLRKSHRYGLQRSHLLEHETTRLGDRCVYDTSGTGLLASRIANGDLAERIAQDEGLPLSRVQVRSPRPGRVEVSRRFTDPWAKPIAHPVLDDGSEIDLPVPGTIRKPLIVGCDPETGDPLALPVWDEDGAKVILIVAKKRAGKTTKLSCIRERVTAAHDAELWNINLSKSVEDREWEPACHLAACGPQDKRKALGMLRRAHQIIDERGAKPRDTAVFQPTPQDPLIVLVIDEIDALVAASPAFVKAELGYIGSKSGSEGVALVIAGQRGTADWMGGSDLRANIDIVCLGKVNRRGEAMHAGGDLALALPDVSAYGEGHAGVWVIAEAGGSYQLGRTFNLRELHDIRKIAAGRAVREPVPAMAESGAHEPGQVLTQSEPWSLSAYDGEHGRLEDNLPPDLRDRLAELDAQNADTKRLLDEAANTAASAPQVHPDDLAASTAERWRQVGENTVIPDEARERLIALLGEGTTISKAAKALGVKPWPVRCYLERLRQEGVAEVAGRGRGTHWRLAEGHRQ